MQKIATPPRCSLFSSLRRRRVWIQLSSGLLISYVMMYFDLMLCYNLFSRFRTKVEIQYMCCGCSISLVVFDLRNILKSVSVMLKVRVVHGPY